MLKGRAAGLRWADLGNLALSIRLIPCRPLLDEREAGDAEECVWLDHEATVWNLFVTPVAPAIAIGLQQLQRTLDAPQLIKDPDFCLNGDVLFELCGGLIDRICVRLRFPVGEQQDMGIGQQERPLFR